MKTKRIILVSCLAVVLLLLMGSFIVNYELTHRVEGQYFESDGVRLYYHIEGKGEPVVLLHGFAVNSDLNWRSPGIVNVLKKEYKVITVDLRGHGLSGKPHDPEAYGVQMVNDVVNLLDHLEIERAHLVGYSLGGFIALKCAALYPERWITVVPMASGWEDPTTSKGLNALKEVAADLKAGKSIGPVIGYFDKSKQPGLMHKVWVKILTTWYNDKEALYALVMSAPDLALTHEELVNIPNPVLGIIGSEDPFLNSAKMMHENIDNSELLIVEGANHITTPRRKEAQQALLHFLEDHSLSASSYLLY